MYTVMPTKDLIHARLVARLRKRLKEGSSLRRQLRILEITQRTVAREAGVTEFCVSGVLSGRLVSANVFAAARRVIDAERAARRRRKEERSA